MKQLHAKSLTRQQRLKIWTIESGFDSTELSRLSGISKQSIHHMLNRLDSIPPRFHDLCLQCGIPADLIPPATRPKADLLRENQELRARIAYLEGRSGSAQSSPQAQAS